MCWSDVLSQTEAVRTGGPGFEPELGDDSGHFSEVRQVIPAMVTCEGEFNAVNRAGCSKACPPEAPAVFGFGQAARADANRTVVLPRSLISNRIPKGTGQLKFR